MDKEKDKQQNSMAIAFGDIPKVPTQDAIDGIKFDFNDGLRVLIPKGAKSYRIRFVDRSAALICESGLGDEPPSGREGDHPKDGGRSLRENERRKPQAKHL